MNYSFFSLFAMEIMVILEGDLWECLYAFLMVIQEPWTVAGDFNVVCWTYEKYGGATHHPFAIAEFNDRIIATSLDDLSLQGPSFT